MRILILATDIFTRGGIARYTWTLASALGELAGPENVEVLALLAQLDGATSRPGKQFQILNPVTTKLSTEAKLRYALRGMRRGRGYDLVICSHLALAPVAAAIRLGYGTPFWVVCHGTEAWPKFSRMVDASVRRAELLLPVSRFTRDRLAEVNRVQPERMHVVYNAIPAEFLEMLERAEPFLWGAGSGEPTILSIGSLESDKRYKGFDTVIRALPEVLRSAPNARYVIVGGGDDKARLEQMARDLGVRNRVTFKGEITDLELAGSYKACHVFALPSRVYEVNGHWSGEGFGRVYVEASLAGKPVLGSLQGGAAEAVVHGRTGYLVDAVSVPELAAALVTLLTESELGRLMGEAGQRWARERFTQAALRNSMRKLLVSHGYASSA
jgi:phosphatidylinositol alpha-1,6-mannosyltransferase